jgi:hypothetical protein
MQAKLPNYSRDLTEIKYSARKGSGNHHAKRRNEEKPRPHNGTMT